MPHMLSRTIAGHPFTLKAGCHYTASRSPFAEGTDPCPVSVHETGSGPSGEPHAVVEGLNRDRADELIAAFNGDQSGLFGKQWVPETPEEWASLGPMEEGGFEDHDFKAADLAWGNIAARKAAGEPPFGEDEDGKEEGPESP